MADPSLRMIGEPPREGEANIRIRSRFDTDSNRLETRVYAVTHDGQEHELTTVRAARWEHLEPSDCPSAVLEVIAPELEADAGDAIALPPLEVKSAGAVIADFPVRVREAVMDLLRRTAHEIHRAKRSRTL